MTKPFAVLLSIIGYLVLIDFGINIIFSYPTDPRNINPSFLQSYFEYGRSIEGKLASMTSNIEAESAPRVSGGWLTSDRFSSLPTKTSDPGQVLLAMYGMSHTQCLWEAIQKTDRKYLIRGYMAAGATPNWAYAAYTFDRGRHQAHVAILGIMTEGVPLITSSTGMTAYFDLSYPYTYPRYYLMNDTLVASFPPFMDAKGYIDYFLDPSKWSNYRSWLSENDRHYDPLLFNRSLLDHSVLIRLLRRAYSEKIRKDVFSNVFTSSGFHENSEEVIVLRSIVKLFADSARSDHIVPILYIVNTKGQSDRLLNILKPTLDTYNIPYLSTHVICPPDDPQVYLSENSHFTLTKDLELAKEMISIIEKELALKTQKP